MVTKSDVVTCSGYGFIKDFDLDENTMYIVTPIEQLLLGRVKSLIKSHEIDFSKSFYLKRECEEDIFVAHNFGQDVDGLIGHDERDQLPPFILDSSCGIGG